MQLSRAEIQAVASMLTDDPDVLVNEDLVAEWWGKSANADPLAAALGVSDPRQVADLKQEFEAFKRYQPNLTSAGPQVAMQAFITYKKTGKMPNSRDGAEMDQLGGDFGRSAPDRVVTPGRLRPGIGN